MLFDPIRNQQVPATPEEIVRQKLIRYLIEELHYPKELIVVEKELSSLPHITTPKGEIPQRRADLILYGKGIHPTYSLYPMVLIECKAIPLNEAARQQVIGYNHYVQAYFIGLANEETLLFGEKQRGEWQFHDYFPTYQQLHTACKELAKNH
jgi:hypothetical protein